MLILVRIMNTGKSYAIEVMSINLERSNPILTPQRVEAVNCETLLPEMSPMLFLLANYTLILARDAALNKKQIFLPMFAIEAKAKKCYGNFNVQTSM